jgi:hypothetical protein
MGEGVVKKLRPLVAKGVHGNWATSLLLAHYQHWTIDMLLEVTNETAQPPCPVSKCPLGDTVELSKFQRFSTLSEVSHTMKSGNPFPVLLFGGVEN